MNVCSHTKQQSIPNINFQQHLSGFIASKNRHQNYSAVSSPNLSRIVNRPHTTDHKKYQSTNQHPVSGRTNRQANIQGTIQKKQEQYYQGLYQQQQFSGEQNREIKKQQQRHIQFVKSYHQWLKETQVEEYQSSRMINSFGLKKTRASLKPKRETQIFQFKVYQPHFNHQYHPPNLFPSRTHRSLKKMQPKNTNYTINHQRPKHKNEGQLKIQVIKSIAKRQNSTKEEKQRKTYNKVRSNHDQSCKNLTLFMKTFSNPRLLSIKNGQLVTGTKIVINH